MAETKRDTKPAKKAKKSEVADIITMLRTYVKQETLGPLKGVGRKIGFGLGGVLALGLGLLFLALGLLRLIQAKVPRLAEGSLSWISYLIVFVFCVAVSGLAVWRITKIEKELN